MIKRVGEGKILSTSIPFLIYFTFLHKIIYNKHKKSKENLPQTCIKTTSWNYDCRLSRSLSYTFPKFSVVLCVGVCVFVIFVLILMLSYMFFHFTKTEIHIVLTQDCLSFFHKYSPPLYLNSSVCSRGSSFFSFINYFYCFIFQ